jgi:hypothetical protein
MDKLTALQDALVDEILFDFKRQKWSLLKTGQRSGKNFLTHEIARRGQYVKVYISTSLEEVSCRSENFLANVPGIQVLKSLAELKAAGSDPILVVMDEAFWKPNSYKEFMELREIPNLDILIIGSRGPEYDKDLHWQLLPGRSFSTWDLNPGVSFESIFNTIKDIQYAKVAVRDFFSF